MALHWNTEDINNWDEINEGFDWDVTEAIIWGTMLIGMNKITEENADEFFVRLKMSEAIAGCPFYKTDEDGEQVDAGWQPEMIRRRIGLRTNATPLTKAQFHKRISARLREAAEIEVSAEA